MKNITLRISLSPSLPLAYFATKAPFSREALGKGAGIPPDRAYYALETILCAVGREAGVGGTLLVDCGVGVLAARGGVVKFTFVQVWKAVRHMKKQIVHIPRDRSRCTADNLTKNTK